MAKIGVALSGGGHRASLFGLGVLLYLVDARKNCDVRAISSVSGGSLTNGYVALRGNYRGMTSDVFEGEVKPFARRVAEEGTLWGWYGTWLYLVAVAATFAAAAFVLATAWSDLVRGLACTGFVLLAGILLLLRGHVCGRAIAARVLGCTPKLADIADAELDHVICATDLHAGEHVYFSGRFVCAFRFGWGKPADIPLHVAVQSSAAFPGAFPPRWVRARRFAFVEGERAGARWMTLLDGGVYDNMAEQWLTGVNNRKNRNGWKSLAADLHEPEELIVVNGAKNLSWSSRWLVLLPWLGEVFALKTVTDVTYDNTTTYRRRGLVEQFDRAEREGKGLRGCLLMLEQSPHKVAAFFATQTIDWPERAARSADVLGLLGPTGRWDELAEANGRVPTTLRALGAKRSADLLEHGYLLAMCNLHVLLGYPLLPLPDSRRFKELVS